MANPEHLEILAQGVETWNMWLGNQPNVLPDLSGADLRGVNLSGAVLIGVNLWRANLANADFSFVHLGATILDDVDLSEVKNLESVTHYGPSSIGIDTIYKSRGNIPEKFLHGCGVPESLITQIPALVAALEPIQFHSCFISYSHKDEDFARRLYSRMKEANLRVWYAPEEMRGGRKLHEQIFSAIQVHDKLLLVLSENSLQSEWVMTEIHRARKAERDESRRKLFPIRLVDFNAIREWECFDPDSGKDLAVELREYYMPDFSNWKDHDAFEAAFDKLLRDLKATFRTLSPPKGKEVTQIKPQFEETKTNILNVSSVAVLPFDSLGTDPENKYLCDGLAGELINNLAKIEGLKVAARTSTFLLKDKKANISEIGRILNVNSVLEGSVLKAGKHVRITVELVSVLHGHCLWAEEYDREMEDVFDIQDEITLAVVDALKVKLLGEQKAAALKRYTDNVEAYVLYFKGRYYFYKHTGEGWLKAIEYFEKAIEVDPGYAPAYAGLSSVFAFAWYFGALHPDEAISKWQIANRRALEIGGNLEETHIAVGRFRFLYEWDWEETEREYKRAIELKPSNADAHQQYGLFLVSKGRFEEAIVEGRRSVELDPLSLLVNFHVGWIYWLAGRWDDAFRQVQRLIEIAPNFYPAYWVMGATYMMRGEYEEAIEAYQKSLSVGGGYQVLSSLGHSYGLLGKRDEALGVINQLLELRERFHVTAFNISVAYGGLRENDKALEWLEKAYQERNGELVYIKVQAEMGTEGLWGKEFRTDPRFQDLLRRIGIMSE